MMDAMIHHTIEQDTRLAAAVEQATAFLAGLSDRSREPAKADWNLTRDAQGQVAVELRLTDPTTSVQGRFRTDELLDLSRRKRLLLDLWDDLLAARSEEHLRRVRQMVEQLEKD